MAGAHQTTPSLPSSVGQGEEKTTKGSLVKDRERSFVHQHNGQNRPSLGKLIELISNEIMDNEK